VIGSAVVRDIKKKNQAKASQPSSSATSSGSGSSQTRAANREAQTALNYFGFPVGAPDGVIGKNTRAGIADFQAYLVYPVTGELTPYQQDFLVSSYYRAQAGGAATQQAIAANPEGSRGLLATWSAESVAAAGAKAGAATAAAPALGAGKLPSFVVEASGTMPLSAWCMQVEGATEGVVEASADANVVLAGQFCSARAAAIGESDALMVQVSGFTPEQIAEQCRDFGPVLKDFVTALGQDPEAQVLERVSGWTAASGIAPENLAGMARVCLGSGYAADDLVVAIGTALVLTALGETGYAELPGHHLSQGVGVPRRPDLALDWYDTAVTAAVPVFSAGDPARVRALRKAAATVGGRADAGENPALAAGDASVTGTAAFQ
jgi:peptidoglycan hydrolase-like protein with peptidoglycan-binding domain